MQLTEAINRSLGVFLSMPEGSEVDTEGVRDPLTLIGIGYCVGRGWAVYRGSGFYRMTDTGRFAALTFDKAESR